MKKLLVFLILLLPMANAMTQQEKNEMIQHNSDTCLQDPLFCAYKAYEFNVIREINSGRLKPGVTVASENRRREIYRQCFNFYVYTYQENWRNGRYKLVRAIDFIAK